MSPSNHRVLNGYEEYEQFLASFQGDENVFVLFSASSDPNASCPFRPGGGKPTTWCSDCNKLDELTEQMRKHRETNPQTQFILVQIEKDYWKGDSNKFRSEQQIERIPTFVHLASGRKAVEAECTDVQKLNFVFRG